MLVVSADLDELSLRAAERVASVINHALQHRQVCAIALAGGQTPRSLYRHLATTFREQIPWPRVEVFWGDERYVPSHHPDSNYGMAKDALLDHVPCPAQNVHPMPVSCASADDAARDYERTLRTRFGEGGPRFDLIILGLGADGHTASVFPESPALVEPERWVMAVDAPATPPRRLTLTLPVLTRAATIHVLASGATKGRALEQALTGPDDSPLCPAAHLRRTSGTLTWWIDQPALDSSGVILR